MVDAVDAKIEKAKIGKVFKNKAQAVTTYLTRIAEDEPDNALKLQEQLSKGPTKVKINGEEFEISPEFASYTKVQKKVVGNRTTISNVTF